MLYIFMVNQGDLCPEDPDFHPIIKLYTRQEIIERNSSIYNSTEEVKCGYGEATITEGSIMIACYASYILFMVFNQR